MRCNARNCFICDLNDIVIIIIIIVNVITLVYYFIIAYTFNGCIADCPRLKIRFTLLIHII